MNPRVDVSLDDRVLAGIVLLPGIGGGFSGATSARGGERKDGEERQKLDGEAWGAGHGGHCTPRLGNRHALRIKAMQYCWDGNFRRLRTCALAALTPAAPPSLEA